MTPRPTPRRAREAPFPRGAFPGLVGVLVLVACTLTGSVAAASPAQVLAPAPVAHRTPVPEPPPPGRSRPSSPPSPVPHSPVPHVPVVDTAPRAGTTVVAPRRIEVQGLTPMPVAPVGVTENGDMELPGTPDVAGWYRFGPTVGAPRGSVVLAAHVDVGDRLGPFAGLAGLDDGAAIRVSDAEGDDHDYVVQHVVRLPKTGVPWEEVFDQDGAHRLVLVTCGGPWDPERGYRDNVVVVAGPREP